MEEYALSLIKVFIIIRVYFDRKMYEEVCM